MIPVRERVLGAVLWAVLGACGLYVVGIAVAAVVTL